MSDLLGNILVDGMEQVAFERTMAPFKNAPGFANDPRIRDLVESVARLAVRNGMAVMAEFVSERR